MKKWIVPAVTWRLHIYTDECLEKSARSFFIKKRQVSGKNFKFKFKHAIACLSKISTWTWDLFLGGI